jgi:DNA repair protein RecO (recombination protein O)
MPAEQATALVLRTIEFSETSLVVTLLTREFGKVQGLAKGARRLKGPFESALDLLSTCRVVFLRKSSDALDLLTEAKLLKRFRPPGRDLSRLYAGYYVAELLAELTHDYDPHPALFDAASAALDELSGTAVAAAGVVLRFELAALADVGHLPALEHCAECGTPIVPQGRVAFGMLAGGALCPRCRQGKRQVASVSAAVIETLAAFSQADSAAWRDRPVESRTMGELRGVLNRYWCNLLGKRPRMHRYLAG